MPGGGALDDHAAGCQPTAGRCALSIRDTGVGMDAGALARIFEPYFSTKAIGTGLGLTIAKRNVELHGGPHRASRARPGRGTTVHVELPLAGPAAAGASA